MSRYTKFEEVLEYLRGFATMGLEVPSPVHALSVARKPQLDKDGRPKPGSILHGMSCDRIGKENKTAIELEELWDKQNYCAPQHILRQILAKDCPWDCAKRSEQDVTFALNRHSSIAARYVSHLEDVSRYQSGPFGHEKQEEGMDNSAKILIALDTMANGKGTIPNPLCVLRSHEDAQPQQASNLAELVPDGLTLDDLDGLSTRLWHMATSARVGDLRERLLLQPDGGDKDLDLMVRCGELLGLERAWIPQSDEEAQEFFNQQL